MWELPGGYVDETEDPAVTAAREVEEETGPCGCAGATPLICRDRPVPWSPVTLHAFVDESSRSRYLLAVAIVAPEKLAQLRTLMRGLRLPGERSVHFNDEHDARRRKIASCLVGAGVQSRVYIGSGHNDLVREACLRTMVGDLVKADTRRLVIESRDRESDRSDRRIIADALLATPSEDLTYEHLEPHEDPALWIPDAVAWCYGAGGSWRQRIDPVVQVTVDVGKIASSRRRVVASSRRRVVAWAEAAVESAKPGLPSSGGTPGFTSTPRVDVALP